MKDTCLFYLDDDKEKDKEKEFKVTVNFIVSVFIFSAAFVMMITVSESIGENKYFLNINDLNLNTGIKTGSFYTVFLVVNALFSISLHQPLYINSLTLDIPNILYNMKGQDSEENIKKVRRYSQGRFFKTLTQQKTNNI